MFACVSSSSIIMGNPGPLLPRKLPFGKWDRYGGKKCRLGPVTGRILVWPGGGFLVCVDHSLAWYVKKFKINGNKRKQAVMKENENNNTAELENPVEQYPQPPFKEQQQPVPGLESELQPVADHGEESYKGSGKLEGRKAIITGGDSGIGRAVAIAFAREGSDVVISYLNEDVDAAETARWVEQAGRKAVLIPGDISSEEHCKAIIERAVDELGDIDILVNNAAFQMTHQSLQELSSEELDHTFKTNIYAMFYLCKAAEPHLKPGSTVVNTTSVNAYKPSPGLLAYATTKGAIQNFTAGLAQLWADKGIRVNCVAPGPIWTPLIPSTMPKEKVKNFGQDVPLQRAGQPAELAAIYVLLASKDSSYMTGSTVQVTGGTPTI
jgi:NAD(P)-dependent dehydrogenase (short-subunit alcohol dehydrogenase family)